MDRCTTSLSGARGAQLAAVQNATVGMDRITAAARQPDPQRSPAGAAPFVGAIVTAALRYDSVIRYSVFGIFRGSPVILDPKLIALEQLPESNCL